VLESIYGNEYTRVTIMVCYYVTGQNYPYPFLLHLMTRSRFQEHCNTIKSDYTTVGWFHFKSTPYIACTLLVPNEEYPSTSVLQLFKLRPIQKNHTRLFLMHL